MASKKIQKHGLCVYRDRLRTVITAESRAYGFTLLAGGSAMFLLDKEGVPGTVDVFLFAAGALAAMMVVVLFSFRRLGQPVFLRFNLPVVPWILIHAISIFGGLVSARLALSLLSGHVAFFGTAFAGILIYNILLGLEAEIAGSPAQKKEC